MKRSLWTAAKAALFLGVLAGLAHQVSTRWSALPPWRAPEPLWFAASLVVGFAGALLIPEILRRLFLAHGYSVSFGQAVGLYFLPAQGKYLPGKVWSVVWALALYRKVGAKTPESMVILTLLTGLNIASGLGLGLTGGAAQTLPQIWLPILLAVCLMGLHPALFYRVVDSVLRWRKLPPLAGRLTPRALIGLFGLNALHWLLTGCGLMLLAKSLVPELPLMPALIAVQAVAHTLGILAFFAPAGIGVREGVLLLLLTPLLGSGPALLVAGSQRLWQIAIELPCAAVGWRILATTTAPEQVQAPEPTLD